MRVDNQAAHFQQSIIKAVVIEHAACVFQHAQFEITLGCFGSKITAAVLQIIFGDKGLLSFIKHQRLMLDSLHLFDFF